MALGIDNKKLSSFGVVQAEILLTLSKYKKDGRRWSFLTPALENIAQAKNLGTIVKSLEVLLAENGRHGGFRDELGPLIRGAIDLVGNYHENSGTLEEMEADLSSIGGLSGKPEDIREAAKNYALFASGSEDFVRFFDENIALMERSLGKHPDNPHNPKIQVLIARARALKGEFFKATDFSQQMNIALLLEYEVTDAFIKLDPTMADALAEVKDKGSEVKLTHLTAIITRKALLNLAGALQTYLANFISGLTPILDRMQKVSTLIGASSLSVVLVNLLKTYQQLYIQGLMQVLSEANPSRGCFSVLELKQALGFIQQYATPEQKKAFQGQFDLNKAKKITPAYVQVCYLSKFVDAESIPADFSKNLNKLTSDLVIEPFNITDSLPDYMLQLELGYKALSSLMSDFITDKLVNLFADLDAAYIPKEYQELILQARLENMFGSEVYFAKALASELTTDQKKMLANVLKSYFEENQKKPAKGKKIIALNRAMLFTINNIKHLDDLSMQASLLTLVMKNAKGLELYDTFKAAFAWYETHKRVLLAPPFSDMEIVQRLKDYESSIATAKGSSIDPFYLQTCLVKIFDDHPEIIDYAFEDLVTIEILELQNQAASMSEIEETKRTAFFIEAHKKLEKIRNYLALAGSRGFLVQVQGEIDKLIKTYQAPYGRHIIPDSLQRLIELADTFKKPAYDINAKIKAFLQLASESFPMGLNPQQLNVAALGLLLEHPIYGGEAEAVLTKSLQELFLDLYIQKTEGGERATLAAEKIENLLANLDQLGGVFAELARELDRALSCYYMRYAYQQVAGFDLTKVLKVEQFDDEAYRALTKHYLAFAKAVEEEGNKKFTFFKSLHLINANTLEHLSESEVFFTTLGPQFHAANFTEEEVADFQRALVDKIASAIAEEDFDAIGKFGLLLRYLDDGRLAEVRADIANMVAQFAKTLTEDQIHKIRFDCYAPFASEEVVGQVLVAHLGLVDTEYGDVYVGLLRKSSLISTYIVHQLQTEMSDVSYSAASLANLLSLYHYLHADQQWIFFNTVKIALQIHAHTLNEGKIRLLQEFISNRFLDSTTNMINQRYILELPDVIAHLSYDSQSSILNALMKEFRENPTDSTLAVVLLRVAAVPLDKRLRDVLVDQTSLFEAAWKACDPPLAEESLVDRRSGSRASSASTATADSVEERGSRTSALSIDADAATLGEKLAQTMLLRSAVAEMQVYCDAVQQVVAVEVRSPAPAVGLFSLTATSPRAPEIKMAKPDLSGFENIEQVWGNTQRELAASGGAVTVKGVYDEILTKLQLAVRGFAVEGSLKTALDAYIARLEAYKDAIITATKIIAPAALPREPAKLIAVASVPPNPERNADYYKAQIEKIGKEMTHYYMHYVAFGQNTAGWTHGDKGRRNATVGYVTFMRRFGLPIPNDVQQVVVDRYQGGRADPRNPAPAICSNVSALWDVTAKSLSNPLVSAEEIYKAIIVTMQAEITYGMNNIYKNSHLISRYHSFTSYMAVFRDIEIPHYLDPTQTVKQMHDVRVNAKAASYRSDVPFKGNGNSGAINPFAPTATPNKTA